MRVRVCRRIAQGQGLQSLMRSAVLPFGDCGGLMLSLPAAFFCRHTFSFATVEGAGTFCCSSSQQIYLAKP